MKTVLKRKWDAIEHLSEIAYHGSDGRGYNGWREPRVSNAVLFLEALELIKKVNKSTLRYVITPFGKEILKGHISKALLGEEIE